MLLDKITPVDLFIAKKLKKFRLASDISQEKLGELTGVTFQQIQKYETAKNRISASKLFEFSQLLEKPIGSFFQGLKADRMYYNYDFKNEGLQIEEMLDSDKEMLLMLRSFKKIKDAEIRRSLIQHVKSIANSGNKKRRRSW